MFGQAGSPGALFTHRRNVVAHEFHRKVLDGSKGRLSRRRGSFACGKLHSRQPRAHIWGDQYIAKSQVGTLLARRTSKLSGIFRGHMVGRSGLAWFMACGVLSLMSRPASANVLELGVNAGAKLNGMAGAGSAHVSGSTAAVVNPAGLSATERFDANVSFVGLYGVTRAPANGPGTDVTATSFTPLPMATLAYRLGPRLAAGLYFYAPSGAGATFNGVDFGVPGLPPRPFGASLYDLEGGPALAVHLPWRFDIGVAYRVTWIKGTIRGYDPSSLASGSPAYSQITMSGTDFTGFKIGIQATPIDRLRLGLVYRTPIVVDVSGRTTVLDGATGAVVAEMDSTASVRNVDKLLAGVSYEWIAGVLRSSFDYEHQFYSRSRDILVVTAAGETNIPQHYRDSNIFRLGSEFQLMPSISARLGVALFDNFRERAYVNATGGGAPAATYLVSAGGGWAVTRTVSVDVSYSLLINRGTVEADGLDPTATPGNYNHTAHAFSLNVGFRN